VEHRRSTSCTSSLFACHCRRYLIEDSEYVTHGLSCLWSVVGLGDGDRIERATHPTGIVGLAGKSQHSTWPPRSPTRCTNDRSPVA
jgi:hypothetical protein